MSALASTIIDSLADTQGTRDARRIAIDKVGVRDVVYPVCILSRSGEKQRTVAHFDMYVNLRHDRKGTHMSRFLEILHCQDREITVRTFQGMAREMVGRLEADAGYLAMRFPYFIDKTAPVSGARSLLNYEVALKDEFGAGAGASRTRIEVTVPITSLCPCSRDIADYGAHSQRAHVTLNVRIDHFMWIEELIDLTEARASSELYGLLKRPDEKYVTERAYDNPKFVEDIVRDIAADLNAEPRILAYTVECENFESIHNHSAYAMIEKDKERKSAR